MLPLPIFYTYPHPPFNHLHRNCSHRLPPVPKHTYDHALALRATSAHAHRTFNPANATVFVVPALLNTISYAIQQGNQPAPQKSAQRA